MKKFIKKTKLFKKLSAFVLILSLCSTCFTSFPVSAAGNMAFSVGCESGPNDPEGCINTTADATTSCDYYALAGYLSRYTANPNMTKINNSYNGVKLMESDIIMLSGHANEECFHFNSLGQGGEYDFYISEYYNAYGPNCIKLSNFNMNNVKLIIMAGCLTALGTYNIARTAYNLGVDSSIGWEVETCNDCASEWLNRFNNCIALGYTVQGAINYANSFNYPRSCTCVKNYKLYGSGSQVLKRNSTSSIGTVTTAEMSIPKISNTAITKANLSNKNTIGQIIKKAYSDFWFEDFNIDVVNNDENNAVITVTEKIGEYSTQNAYVLFYSNGKITEVYDRTIKKLDTNEANSILASKDIVNEKEIFAIASQNISNDRTVKEQSGKLMLDVETGKRYYATKTVIENANGTFFVENYNHFFN